MRELSNGAGDCILTGNTNHNDKRRALVKSDMSDESGEIISQKGFDLGKSRIDIFSITGSIFFPRDVRLSAGTTVIESKTTDLRTYINRVSSSGSSIPGNFILI